jgi:transcriptional regulator with XRE-family HTH domain
MTLSDYLAQKDLTLTEFASLGGWSIASVWHWKTGSRIPRMANLKKIMQITDGAVTLADFGPEMDVEDQIG